MSGMRKGICAATSAKAVLPALLDYRKQAQLPEATQEEVNGSHMIHVWFEVSSDISLSLDPVSLERAQADELVALRGLELPT